MFSYLNIKDTRSENPGFGGQSFIESQLKKIEEIRKRIDETGKDIELEVS